MCFAVIIPFLKVKWLCLSMENGKIFQKQFTMELSKASGRLHMAYDNIKIENMSLLSAVASAHLLLFWP